MDLSLIGAAASAIGIAKEVGRAAIGVRDANQLAETITRMNEQLLKAQDTLFAHNAQLLQLQQQYFEAAQELRVVKETMAERNRYTLFELTAGNHVYRADARPVLSESGDPIATEPEHYICQPCFDKPPKTKVVLRFIPAGEYEPAFWDCPICKSTITLR